VSGSPGGSPDASRRVSGANAVMSHIGHPESDRRVQGAWTRQRLVRPGLALVLGLAVYALAAYLIILSLWHIELLHHPALQGAPRLIHTAAGIPGDPLNIALVATEREVVHAMLAAAWHPADPLTLDTSLRMAGSVVFRRPYGEAPVSPLYLWDRREDLAFEQAVGGDPARRHHVRLWRSGAADMMLGSASAIPRAKSPTISCLMWTPSATSSSRISAEPASSARSCGSNSSTRSCGGTTAVVIPMTRMAG
jgi:hypothetical protein